MKRLDKDKLAKFRNGIISHIADDGFPYSIPAKFQVTRDGDVLLEKPKSIPELAGKKVGVLFNHITAIPTGGYTDRRYVLVSGSLDERHGMWKLNPEQISEWDEKVLPFDQLCARAVPQGAKYLKMLQAPVEA